LAFELTNAQKKVISEIHHDLLRAQPMLRLVQGDVGSGKTVVAAMAMLQAIASGYQVALLAPTELLVEQHYRTFQAWFSPLNITVVMLAGQMKASEREKISESIQSGTAQVVIGTHAIFQKKILFFHLALIIVDEQHRFGVQQRAMLREKGICEGYYPHQLIMTATPIPRTLAMSVYADLDYSVIDELPPNRLPITTRVLSDTRRDDILERIRLGCSMGRQAYWVCTLIQESETLECQAAENTANTLAVVLPELKIALLHGRMKSIEKDNIMQAFKAGEIDLLVATTVIEVGVDVPNASLMVIENAERLGLAQLHQLRGRVGRGAMQSHCLLLYQLPISRLAQERLAVMRATQDGFQIAQRDLELRGPGEVLGTKQTGDIAFRIADLVRDADLFPAVQQAADMLLKDYPEVAQQMIQRWLFQGERYGRV
jgi:ATP-dependent DNA helicase RecG